MTIGPTGVIWSARGTERLVRELFDGPGSVFIECSAAGWTLLAELTEDFSHRFSRILTEVSASWESDSLAHLTARVLDISREISSAAIEYRVIADSYLIQSANVTTARMSISALSEVVSAVEMQNNFQQLGNLGTLLTGGAAVGESVVVQQRESAAEVMQTYELATEKTLVPVRRFCEEIEKKFKVLSAEKAGSDTGSNKVGRAARSDSARTLGSLETLGFSPVSLSPYVNSQLAVPWSSTNRTIPAGSMRLSDSQETKMNSAGLPVSGMPINSKEEQRTGSYSTAHSNLSAVEDSPVMAVTSVLGEGPYSAVVDWESDVDQALTLNSGILPIYGTNSSDLTS